MSKFIGMGVGPGDPELVTVSVVNALKSLDVLIVPAAKKGGESFALSIVKGYLGDGVSLQHRHFPMVEMAEAMPAIEAIANDIEGLVLEGKRVGFITLGDPMLYSTYGYLIQCLTDRIPVKTIPGISSYSAIASATNRILVEGDMPLVIYPCTGDLERLEAMLLQFEALVLMKVYKQYPDVVALLKKHRLLDYAVAVKNFGRADEERLSLQGDEDIGYFTTILVNRRQAQ